jgi:hypothetical protein
MAMQHAKERGAETRVLLLRADGCVLCVALDAVQGVHACDGVSQDAVTLPGARRIPAVRWTAISGVRGIEPRPRPRWVAVVRTPAGPVALEAEDCLGVRAVSLLESPPVPTHLVDASGSPLCYLVLLDERPCFLLEPRALNRATSPEEPTWPVTATPRPVEESGGDRVIDG